MRIQVCDREYTFVFEDLKLSILRYGEIWLESPIQGEQAIVGLMHKLQELVQDGKEFEKLFIENVNPTTNKVSLSYSFLKALRERHAEDQKQIAELRDALEKTKHEKVLLIEKAAVIAWNVYMDTCKKNGIGPAGWEHWCSANEIRKLKDEL
jgi:hypothetical protein